ncbi:MAG: LCP family protein [Candidatus Promineifilaceae bacterium]|jgi:LCP family protein required for cell wall assembly
MTSDPDNKHASTGRKSFPMTYAILGLVLLTFFLVSAFWLYNTIRDIASVSSNEIAEFTPGEVETVTQPSEQNPDQEELAEEPLPVIITDELEPWSGTERINILLLGTDRRCNETGPNHSDTLLLATIDPESMTAKLLSLPRDLWVEIPGFGVDRINQAYYFGQIYEYPGGGPALASETVESFLGVPVDYFITVDFQSFEDAVNLIGGIVIDVPESIDDPNYPDNCYGYDPFSIAAGKQRLDGAAALKYARTRATLGGDVDRAGRQQAVLMAIRDQVLNLNQLPKLIAQAPTLWRTFQENVKTNLSLEDALEIALLIQDIQVDNIDLAVLDYDYVYIETTPDGRQILVPRRDQIRVLRDELFPIQAVPTPVYEDLQQLMEDEAARVAIHNGTAVFGLAADTQTYLQNLGVTISGIGNADSAAIDRTQIIDYGSHPQTTQFLIQEMQIPPMNLSEGEKAEGDYDILIIIGNDWAGQLSPSETSS